MPRRLRARNDVDWIRVAIGAAVGLILAPGACVLAYYLALWTRQADVFGIVLLSTPAIAIIGICIATPSIWSRLIVALLSVPVWLYAYFLMVLNYGCRLQVKLGLPMTACL